MIFAVLVSLATGVLFGRVGVGHAEAGQDSSLQTFHDQRLGGVLVVEAVKVQHAMHDQVPQMVGERLSLRRRLGHADLTGQGDVARVALCARTSRKGQHIGRLVLATEACVQRPDRRIVRQQNGDVAWP